MYQLCILFALHSLRQEPSPSRLQLLIETSRQAQEAIFYSRVGEPECLLSCGEIKPLKKSFEPIPFSPQEPYQLTAHLILGNPKDEQMTLCGDLKYCLNQ